MSDALILAARAFLQVAPVAASTYFVSHDRWGAAIVTGFVISFVWYANVGTAAQLTGWPWAIAYACGGAAGTAVGQWTAKRLTCRAAFTKSTRSEVMNTSRT